MLFTELKKNQVEVRKFANELNVVLEVLEEAGVANAKDAKIEDVSGNRYANNAVTLKYDVDADNGVEGELTVINGKGNVSVLDRHGVMIKGLTGLKIEFDEAVEELEKGKVSLDEFVAKVDTYIRKDVNNFGSTRLVTDTGKGKSFLDEIFAQAAKVYRQEDVKNFGQEKSEYLNEYGVMLDELNTEQMNSTKIARVENGIYFADADSVVQFGIDMENKIAVIINGKVVDYAIAKGARVQLDNKPAGKFHAGLEQNAKVVLTVMEFVKPVEQDVSVFL